MPEERVELEREGGTLAASLYVPTGDDGRRPLVVFYMDAFGLRPALGRMARRLADAGYAVLQPDLYWRFGPLEPLEPAKVFGDPVERERLMKLMNGVRLEDVLTDTLALVEEVAADPRVSTERLGCVGYCMGGRLAFGVASELPERVVACASIHPGGLVTEAAESPHHRANAIRGVVYLGIADEDPGCTPEHQRVLGEALAAAGVPHTLELYAGARHGFAVPDLPVYDAEAAERHWSKVLGLFESELRG